MFDNLAFLFGLFIYNETTSLAGPAVSGFFDLGSDHQLFEIAGAVTFETLHGFLAGRFAIGVFVAFDAIDADIPTVFANKLTPFAERAGPFAGGAIDDLGSTIAEFAGNDCGLLEKLVPFPCAVTVDASIVEWNEAGKIETSLFRDHLLDFDPKKKILGIGEFTKAVKLTVVNMTFPKELEVLEKGGNVIPL